LAYIFNTIDTAVNRIAGGQQAHLCISHAVFADFNQKAVDAQKMIVVTLLLPNLLLECSSQKPDAVTILALQPQPLLLLLSICPTCNTSADACTAFCCWFRV
jgi:hypothetical protein